MPCVSERHILSKGFMARVHWLLKCTSILEKERVLRPVQGQARLRLPCLHVPASLWELSLHSLAVPIPTLLFCDWQHLESSIAGHEEAPKIWSSCCTIVPYAQTGDRTGQEQPIHARSFSARVQSMHGGVVCIGLLFLQFLCYVQCHFKHPLAFRINFLEKEEW